MSLNILIGADLVPTKSNISLFEQGNVKQLIGEELRDKLNQSDFTIFNLEVPLTDDESPIEKCGPNLIAPTSTIEGIKKINPHFFTLSNNHIFDQGEQGMFSTMRLLDKYGIAHAGTGKNLTEARKPYIFQKDGIKVGIYCCAEHEFSIASENKPGANPFDPFESLDDIVSLRNKCDYVIVLYHGGKEHNRFPSPYLQKVCRKIIEKGANLVVCQHSHCIGCKENWNNGIIVYGQGNFLFDHSESDFWQTSLLLDLTISKEKIAPTLDFIPLKKNKNAVRLADETDKKEMLNNFFVRSANIEKQGFVEEQYKLFSKQKQMNYLTVFAGNLTSNIVFRIINKLTGSYLQKMFLKILYTRKRKIALVNFVECEAHRELLIEGLKANKK